MTAEPQPPLDALLQFGLQMTDAQPSIEDGTPEEARRYAATDAFNIERIELPRVEDFSIPGTESMYSGQVGPPVSVRLYAPRDRAAAGDGGLPAMVYCHGGGFVIGSVDSFDRFLRLVCRDSGMIVIAVDYRLAPEHRFPAALDDCLTAYAHVAARTAELGIDPERLGVGGDSAGGQLAVNICFAASAGHVPRPAFQALIYPWLDGSRETDSHRRYGEGYGLTRKTIQWFLGHAMPTPDFVHDPVASPLLRAPEEFADLPPAHILLSGYDPLRDEGTRYHELLRRHDIPSQLVVYETLIHGILNLGGLVPNALKMMEAYAQAAKQLAER